MQEAVSSILIGRSREADGLSRMILVSLVIHGLFMTALVLVPRDWLRTAPEEKVTPMMISLGPSGTQDTGGMTSITSRPVQAETPPDVKPVTAPPAAKAPEMMAPAPDVKPKPLPKPVSRPVEQSPTRKPSTGPELKSGAARVLTPNAAQVAFGGLAERSGASSAGGPQLDVANFCCPEYIETMTQRIRSNWDQQQGAAGQTLVKFTIRRDGMLTNVEVEKSSNNPLLDLESRRAVLGTRQLPPLPDQFNRPTLTVYLTFDYKR
jgi:TonB family protein